MLAFRASDTLNLKGRCAMSAAEIQGSTVPRRQLGRHLRDLREKSPLTVEKVADALECSKPSIWRWEAGRSRVKVRDVRALCELYEADPQLTEALVALAKETTSRGWWHAYGDVIPEWFDVYIGLEEAADSISSFEAELVPGLLQTEDYARTVIRSHNREESEEEINRRVQLRIARQSLLRRTIDRPELRVLLGEPILRRPVGGPQVMAAQLDHLVAVSMMPNVSLHIVPDAKGFHLGLVAGPFVILRFPANGNGTQSEPPTVYTDGLTGGLYLDKPGEIARYESVFDDIYQLSLGDDASRDLITRASEELRK